MAGGYTPLYFAKKAFSLYPGILAPRSARFLEEHYATRRRRRSVTRTVLDAAIGCAFLLWVPLRAAAVARRHRLGRGWAREATRIAWQRFADPNDLALFRITRAEELDLFLRRFEDAGINKMLNPLGWSDACALADKLRFHDRANGAGLPTAMLIARADNGHAIVMEEPAGRDLILKPARGEGGGGVIPLERVASAAELHARLAGLPSLRRGRWLVEERVRPDPDLRDIALTALPTVRMVTILDEQGAAELVSATFRCASDPAAVVDNMKAGGLMAPVELATGVLGLACTGYGGGDHRTHPVTGGAIEGRVLPHWNAATALVKKAHDRAFGDYVIVGWDVALTPDGPLLIEGNGKPGVLMPQRAARRGIGAGRYGELLRHHLLRRANAGAPHRRAASTR
ncbi:hypothetical protein EYB45_07495 [Erythrobacteraceae bacterium CFH 75059]|uniref:sugar-transfer associated ATP-grasp domain-containing protein n=1 Tax=Qipengyuania thermophila TaxID=2509361 RepID=UPI00102108B3|nr:sugar-transfer associated ATP-grasp domain-containing protein [Qipengyuania thermophila]TCD05314.1 hypothetical protein EYB45_07495 [Erythrobacteraceae bacterium CFH 75059]